MVVLFYKIGLELQTEQLGHKSFFWPPLQLDKEIHSIHMYTYNMVGTIYYSQIGY